MDSTNNPLLINARFLRLWIGQGTSFLGDAVSMVALVVLVVQITGSASAVGGALAARLLPTLASPLAGVLADRLDRRLVLVASDLTRAVLVLGLVFAADLTTIYVHVFFMGLARTLFNPTIRAAFPSVVGAGISPGPTPLLAVRSASRRRPVRTSGPAGGDRGRRRSLHA
jgi:MFS family permease